MTLKMLTLKNTKTKLILLLEDSPAKHSHMLERVRVSKTREELFSLISARSVKEVCPKVAIGENVKGLIKS